MALVPSATLGSNTTKLVIQIVLFLVWLLIGAGVFIGVEKPYETQRRDKLNFPSFADTFKAAHNISTADMDEFLNKLQTAVDLGYDIEQQKYMTQWDFMNAFFFAGNVVTTIGYGHIVPATVAGRILCIFYALVGIPITGLTLRSVGNRISEEIAKLVRLFERKVYNRETDRLEIKTACVAFLILVLIILIPAVGFAELEMWTYEDSVYFCFITLTTIGFGDFVPGKLRGKEEYNDAIKVAIEFLNLIYMVVGLAVMSGVIVSISGVIEEKTKSFSMGETLEALKNIREENVNSRALKKLGYRLGTNPRDVAEVGSPTPRMTPRELHVPRMKGRSVSAEKVHFQGPTPIMQLSNVSGEEKSPKVFKNKVSPLSESTTEVGGVFVNPEALEQSEYVPIEEGSDCSENSRRVRPNSCSLKGRFTEKRESKNELIVEVQLTPLPTPRSSPISFQVTERPSTSKEIDINNDVESPNSVASGENAVRADALLRNDSELSEVVDQNEDAKMKDEIQTKEPSRGNEINGLNEPTGHEMNGLNEALNEMPPVEVVNVPAKILNGVISQPNKKDKLQQERGRKNLKKR